MTAHSSRLRALLLEHRKQINGVLARYGASNPRLFGSVAEGTAGPNSDVDILLEMDERMPGSRLSRLAGVRQDLQELLNMQVDVAYDGLLKPDVSRLAGAHLISL